MGSRLFVAVALAIVCTSPAWAITFALGNPANGSIKSGVSLVSGWVCEAEELEVSFNGGERLFVPYGSERPDTAGVCGDTDNGFGLLINYNELGDGLHTVTLYIDGAVATQVPFNVQTLGTAWLPGVTGQGVVELSDGKHVALQWQETIQGFTITDYNYTGVFPGLDDPNTCTQEERDALSDEYHGDCGSVRGSCANGLRVHRQDTETHYRWACAGSGADPCSKTAECEEEKEAPLQLDRFNGEWQFVFSYEWTCDFSDFRFLCTVTDGILVCDETPRQLGQNNRYTLGLSGDISQAGNFAGEITITGSSLRADGVVAWVEGDMSADRGFGTWDQHHTDGCGGTWSAARR